MPYYGILNNPLSENDDIEYSKNARKVMKKVKLSVKCKVVVVAEIILIMSLAILFYCIGMGEEIPKGILGAGFFVIVFPTLFATVYIKEEKKDFASVVGMLIFACIYIFFYRDTISVKSLMRIFVWMIPIWIIRLFFETGKEKLLLKLQEEEICEEDENILNPQTDQDN